ncbi:hypothetical protein GF386_03850 [Candidatus Pacearchaeota archaeon]|nr:hypothetical protein [Candidatus Pacearchaeota archaeon]MBD3283280.1 hypothetical protein [Candidatus Pacearchaeota archaeon]
MDKKIEKRFERELEKDIEKEVKEEIEQKLSKKLDERLERNLAGDIQKEARRRLKQRMDMIYNSTKRSASKFQKEFRKQTVIAVTAAFAFLIALSWRNPIQELVDDIISELGLGGREIYIEFLSAITITIIGVLVLMLLSRWQAKEN